VRACGAQGRNEPRRECDAGAYTFGRRPEAIGDATLKSSSVCLGLGTRGQFGLIEPHRTGGSGVPEQVTIISPMTFNPVGFNFGTFDASGSAVDNGLLCDSGTVDDTRVSFAGFERGRSVQIPVRKTFTCDDPSGTFFVKIQVHLDFATAMESFSWVVQGGTGAYEHLRRSGRGSTVSDGSDPQTGNINTYVGFLVHRTEHTSR